MQDCNSALYNNEFYWENFLKKANVWQGAFIDKCCSESPVYINCTILDYSNKFLSYDWASCPNAHSTLGFIQYVFIPTFYYSILYPNNKMLFTPIMSQEKLIEEILNSECKQSKIMVHFLELAQKLWGLCDCDCKLSVAIFDFCNYFNSCWNSSSKSAKIEIYTSTNKISEKIKQIFWCDEVLYEETGMDLQDFEKLCSQAQNQHAFRILLLHFLNNKLGCVA